MAVALAVTTGIAYGSIPDSGGVIRACVAKGSGKVRLIDPSKAGRKGHCSKRERKVSWNETGQPGAKGETGAAGAKGDTGSQGPAGLSGYQVLSATTAIGGGVEIVGTLPCPAGKAPTGGGGTTTDNDFKVQVIGSGPSADGTGWSGGMSNSGTETRQLTLTTYCITKPPAAGKAPAATRTSAKPVFTVVKTG